MKAAILFLTYNRFEYTRKSLNSIIQNTDRKKYDLFLWDNSSDEEGMTDWLEETCQQNDFHYLFCSENYGLTTAMNNQMKIMNHLDKYNVFCHIANDVVVPAEWLKGIFEAIRWSDRVGLVGLNFEPKEFKTKKLHDIELEIVEDGPACVGGMHFCIPKYVYDLIGGFRQVKCGYGQQDANYSVKVKYLPNRWWAYYLDRKKYSGKHLGINNGLLLTKENKGEELYHDYHDKMRPRLLSSGSDPIGGRLYRHQLMLRRDKVLRGEMKLEDVVKFYRVPEEEFVKIEKGKILKTSFPFSDYKDILKEF